MNFFKKLEESISKNNSLLCIGLDPDLEKIPKAFLSKKDAIFQFNKAIIDATHDLVCSYKPNIAFYSALGIDGLKSLQRTIKYIHDQYTYIPVILDAKRGDIGSTSEKYTEEVFDVLEADAVTVNPYLGFDAIEPFLKYKNKGIIVLCRTSNPGASDFQDLSVYSSSYPPAGGESRSHSTSSGFKNSRQARTIQNQTPLYLYVAQRVVEWNKQYKNCLMVIGATWSEELKIIRKLTPDMFFLIPGIGAQGGNLQKTLGCGLTKQKSGLIISVSRAILYAKDVRKKAQEFCEEINKCR